MGAASTVKSIFIIQHYIIQTLQQTRLTTKGKNWPESALKQGDKTTKTQERSRSI